MTCSRLLIIDERLTFGRGLRAFFCASPAIQSTQWISDASTAECAAGGAHADVALVSVSLRRRPASEVISRLREMPDPPAVVALVDGIEADTVRVAVEAGAIGVVSMTESPGELLEAILAAGRGVARLPASAVGALVKPASGGSSPDAPRLEALTRREREILELLVAGMDRRAIAARLYCSPETVRTHIRNVLRKLGAHSTVEAVDLAVRSGVTFE